MEATQIEDSRRFSMRSPNVVADIVDNEVVAVNLESGTYFSLFHHAAWLWIAIVSGQPLGMIIGRVAERSSYSSQEVYAFVKELLAYDLIEPLKANATFDPSIDDLHAIPGAPYVPLTINVHRDLQDILLLDPVHDSDEAGWPEAR